MFAGSTPVFEKRYFEIDCGRTAKKEKKVEEKCWLILKIKGTVD